MEKFLKEKILNKSIDEIDKDMITARVANALHELHELSGEFCKKLEKLAQTYKDEFILGGVGITCGVTDVTDSDDEKIGCRVLFGDRDSICRCLKELNGMFTEGA